jgi:pimeloyl-ACP methyl ester carboxylesterase
MNFNRLSLIGIFLFLSGSCLATERTHDLINFGTEDGGKIEASFFESSRSKVVIFAHGAIFNKESWYFLAEAFQQKGVSALSIDFRGYGNSVAGSTTEKMYDILGAITYLKEQGFTDINVVGASMGGAAVLMALGNNSIPMAKVVLLAPAGGPAIASTTIDKLFVVSENEGMFDRVMGIYTASAKPKQIQIYPGNTHAQHLFKTDARDELMERIINFIIPAGNQVADTSSFLQQGL